MTPGAIAVDALLVIAVGTALACAVGVLAMRDTSERLHYLGPLSSVCPAAIMVAVLVDTPLSQATIKAILVTGTLVVMGPVLAHATARAARVRRFGEWTVQRDERVERVARPRER